MMKSYKEFKKIIIGESEIGSLILRSAGEVKILPFGEDGTYRAYECFGDVEIGGHYEKVFSGTSWLTIYDDFGRTYRAICPEGYARVDVYTAGGFGCIIHWKN